MLRLQVKAHNKALQATVTFFALRSKKAAIGLRRLSAALGTPVRVLIKCIYLK
tara:strand:+ start:2799 stop:2957 length:159 start_codon:yes stop_codon:yes gene_type:complete